MLNQRDRLLVCLAHGEVTPDNNTAENAIRPFVIGRKLLPCNPTVANWTLLAVVTGVSLTLTRIVQRHIKKSVFQ
jgi:hypothetical protein